MEMHKLVSICMAVKEEAVENAFKTHKCLQELLAQVERGDKAAGAAYAVLRHALADTAYRAAVHAIEAAEK